MRDLGRKQCHARPTLRRAFENLDSADSAGQFRGHRIDDALTAIGLIAVQRLAELPLELREWAAIRSPQTAGVEPPNQ
jgi:hypothetical protein